MSRLLHAAARGARIQYKWPDSCWEYADSLCNMLEGTNDYRIHPNDAHLTYGPISTALRELAVQGLVLEIKTDWEFVARYYFTEIAWEKVPHDVDHRSLFLLILAEALADEGL